MTERLSKKGWTVAKFGSLFTLNNIVDKIGFCLVEPEISSFFIISGAYSCLRVQLEFGREVSFFLQTIYFPCFIIVIVSWMSFWIDHKAVS